MLVNFIILGLKRDDRIWKNVGGVQLRSGLRCFFFDFRPFPFFFLMFLISFQ